MRARPRLDRNHKDVVSALTAIGCRVTSLAAIGGGVSDILVSYRGRWYVGEIKDGAAGSLTDDQERWIAQQCAPVWIWRSAEEAIKTVTSGGRGYVVE